MNILIYEHTFICVCFNAQQVDKKRAWEMICRKKPDIVKDRETERALQRIATRCLYVPLIVFV